MHSSEFCRGLAGLFLEAAHAGIVPNMPRCTDGQKTGHGIPAILKFDFGRNDLIRCAENFLQWALVRLVGSHICPLSHELGHMRSCAPPRYGHGVRWQEDTALRWLVCVLLAPGLDVSRHGCSASQNTARDNDHPGGLNAAGAAVELHIQNVGVRPCRRWSGADIRRPSSHTGDRLHHRAVGIRP